MSQEQLELMIEAIGQAGHIFILPHNDPDPDAIASSVALRYLLAQHLGLEGRIAYKGIIGRAENRALVRYLNHPLTPLDEAEMTSTTTVALVDTQPGAGNNPWSIQAKVKVAVVFDHHPRRRLASRAAFADVRPDTGATSTIILEYLQAAGLALPSWLATALFYGIKTDTMGLSRGVSSADADAYFYLQPLIEVDALADIERAKVPAAYFRSFAEALESAEVYDIVALAFVGLMEYPDMAAEMADLLLRLEQIEWVICTGVYRDSLILSVRAPGPQHDASEIVQAIVGQEGTAGGHGTMAGGQILLKGRAPEQLVRQLNQRALEYLGLNATMSGQRLI